MAFVKALLLLMMACLAVRDFWNHQEFHVTRKSLDHDRPDLLNSRLTRSAPTQGKGPPMYSTKDIVNNHDEIDTEQYGDDDEASDDKTVKLPLVRPKYIFIDPPGAKLRAKGVFCDFEPATIETKDLCLWTWNITVALPKLGFQVLKPAEVAALNISSKRNDFLYTGPSTDGDGNPEGHFLYLPVEPTMSPTLAMSTLYHGFMESCKFEMKMHQEKMNNGTIRLVGQSITSKTQWVIYEIFGDDRAEWVTVGFRMGSMLQDFNILIEVVRPYFVPSIKPLPHVAFDNIRLIDCLPEPAFYDGQCVNQHFNCLINNRSSCLKLQHTCDLIKDCDDGSDEKLNCEKMPFGSYCDFEHDDCGFYNIPQSILRWRRHTGPTPTEMTGPNYDHTCGNPGTKLATRPALFPRHMAPEKCEGYYFFVNMNETGPNNQKSDFAMTAVLASQIFNPPPKAHGNITSQYYNCCMIRFYYQQNGRNYGSLGVEVVQITRVGNLSTTVWFSTKDKGENWLRATIFLPNVTYRYYIEFSTRMGLRIFSDTAIDDFTLSPECFGLNIPKSELGDYNYYNPFPEEEENATPNPAFIDQSIYKFTSCGASGRYGPNQSMCETAYKGTNTTVTVLNTPPQVGVQVWEVPYDGIYTIIAHGASGGYGSSWTGVSRGAMVRGLFELKQGEKIHMLIGQKGSNACRKTLSGQTDNLCERINPSNSTRRFTSKTQEVRNTEVNDGGGGGGGATFIYTMDNGKVSPLIVAAGGGGISMGVFRDDGVQHGKIWGNVSAESGLMFGNPRQASGAGGGMKPRAGSSNPVPMPVMGSSLMQGAAGGQACVGPAHGGFGGGGGGCLRGGGGGGWAGGNTNQGNGHHGGGGTSYKDDLRIMQQYTEYEVSPKFGSGEVIIIPAIKKGCACDHTCVALDEIRSNVQCYCPHTWLSDARDSKKCILPAPADKGDEWPKGSVTLLSVMATTIMTCVGAILCITVYLYGKYQRRRQEQLSKNQATQQDMQLMRLRNQPRVDNQDMVINPHYGSDVIVSGQGLNCYELPTVSRERLVLIKSLGQGAFGEVYEGMYKFDNPEDNMSVAIKTLPDLSSNQAESDFLMEAAIMNKFNHPNVLRLIGVCFDRHPSAETMNFPRNHSDAGLSLYAYILKYRKFIVLELLIGGDLKCFLRDNRPRAGHPCPITYKDLLQCSYDIAKGCRYLESQRFIHRDIAARNCLLTCTGPGRVAKIADFGLARDIYRSEYYKKGGKAMLPIKWMPPESFVDGVFTSKTDVWSYGVLLWEICSLGVMPYTGCSNREVMVLVTDGGRLGKPYGCPEALNSLMTDCWQSRPDDRPSFDEICERVYRTFNDPDVIDLPVPFVPTLAPPSYPSQVYSNEDYGFRGARNGLNNDYMPMLPSPLHEVVPGRPRALTPEPIPSPPPQFRSTSPWYEDNSTSVVGLHTASPPHPAFASPAPSTALPGYGSAPTHPSNLPINQPINLPIITHINHITNGLGESSTGGVELQLQRNRKYPQSEGGSGRVYLETSFSFNPEDVQAAALLSKSPAHVNQIEPATPTNTPNSPISVDGTDSIESTDSPDSSEACRKPILPKTLYSKRPLVRLSRHSEDNNPYKPPEKIESPTSSPSKVDLPTTSQSKIEAPTSAQSKIDLPTSQLKIKSSTSLLSKSESSSSSISETELPASLQSKIYLPAVLQLKTTELPTNTNSLPKSESPITLKLKTNRPTSSQGDINSPPNTLPALKKTKEPTRSDVNQITDALGNIKLNYSDSLEKFDDAESNFNISNPILRAHSEHWLGRKTNELDDIRDVAGHLRNYKLKRSNSAHNLGRMTGKP